ncbi:hypothetical protein IAQ61_006110 [Plenodomus lingam]|uniref:uncharacterized protein n=1 Tax=Leptosphaeria maculans TaxID=5022 RepID=UPI003331AAA4|nr:hypothetical protein IAQ61_006110 [Plenodomus lingam]
MKSGDDEHHGHHPSIAFTLVIAIIITAYRSDCHTAIGPCSLYLEVAAATVTFGQSRPPGAPHDPPAA